MNVIAHKALQLQVIYSASIQRNICKKICLDQASRVYGITLMGGEISDARGKRLRDQFHPEAYTIYLPNKTKPKTLN